MIFAEVLIFLFRPRHGVGWYGMVITMFGDTLQGKVNLVPLFSVSHSLSFQPYLSLSLFPTANLTTCLKCQRRREKEV
jgi:hypothetical protein